MTKFELEEYHRNIAAGELIKDLKRVAAQLKKESVTIAEYNKFGRFSDSVFRRRFGSWFKALEKAELQRTRNLYIKEKDFIDDLIRVARLLRKDTITIFEYESKGNFSAKPFIRLFGSWFKALERAGLRRTRNLGITEEMYFKNLEEVWTKLGRQPHLSDMKKPLSKYVGDAYAYKFGTWRKALEKFVEYINQEEIAETATNIKVEPVDNILKIYEQKHKTKRNISWRLRFVVMRRDNFKCKHCGRTPATDPKIILHVDHIIPHANGGETVLDNLQTLCSVCNIGKSNLEAQSFTESY